MMSMSSQEPEHLAIDLRRSFEDDMMRPFPYADCRKLVREAGKGCEGLVQDLDSYFAEIAGYCSSGRRILKWPRAKLLEVSNRLQGSFFEKHPEYKRLEPMITQHEVPELWASLNLFECNRARLLQLLSHLLSKGTPPIGCLDSTEETIVD
jgi:hypothetical protein